MLLSTIICPQYLRGGGGLGSFSCMPIILAVPLVVHRHSYALHHPPHHHIQREERQPHRHVIHTPLRPHAHIPWQKALLLYYLVVFFGRNSLYFNTLGALCMNPKGSQAFCSDDWRASWTYVRHILDTPCSLGNRLIPPFHPPFRSLDHVHCKPSTSIASHLRTL